MNSRNIRSNTIGEHHCPNPALIMFNKMGDGQIKVKLACCSCYKMLQKVLMWQESIMLIVMLPDQSLAHPAK